MISQTLSGFSMTQVPSHLSQYGIHDGSMPTLVDSTEGNTQTLKNTNENTHSNFPRSQPMRAVSNAESQQRDTYKPAVDLMGQPHIKEKISAEIPDATISTDESLVQGAFEAITTQMKPDKGDDDGDDDVDDDFQSCGDSVIDECIRNGG